jgi:ribosomal protein L31
MTTDFQPTMLGTLVYFDQEAGKGMITDETVDEIYIEHPFFTGWMSKAEYFESLGVED